ncbi:hypothetical protein [Acidithrix sp. C25]|uniref:hypothetical protein n=1 Tax=Acidithrix sp. C25 TaxID=1671482 RepID=UPI00191B90A7|nr:hypothetical protein [Acidithrix sp. C25]CAG4900250.1 unnamed protein product [Acidithrix sp. C25]
MENERAASKAEVDFGYFQGVDIRVGRVISAPFAVGTRSPSREMTLDFGVLGLRRSIGQFALIPEDDLVGHNILAVVNLGPRKIGKYTSEVLVLGVRHPESPTNQAQALPLTVSDLAVLGSEVF